MFMWFGFDAPLLDVSVGYLAGVFIVSNITTVYSAQYTVS